jgi:hypothetical protein
MPKTPSKKTTGASSDIKSIIEFGFHIFQKLGMEQK